jgi:hypothetical protein
MKSYVGAWQGNRKIQHCSTKSFSTEILVASLVCLTWFEKFCADINWSIFKLKIFLVTSLSETIRCGFSTAWTLLVVIRVEMQND